MTMTTSPRTTDIAILGGGPAGLTAAIYAARTNHSTLLIERQQFGGQISGTQHVENYPGFAEPIGGEALSEAMRAQAAKFGTQFMSAEVRGLKLEDGKKVVETSEGPVIAKSLIVATGSRPRLLGVDGEQKFWGRGISTCATCDGAFFRNKEVLVIGGGDAAVEEGGYLTQHASKVTLIHRRDTLRATQILQERAKNNAKMAFHWNAVVTRYLGDKRLEGVEVQDVNTGAKSELRAPGVFLFIGHIPNTDFLKGIVDLDDHGMAIAERDTSTPIAGLYVAGDLRKGSYMQAVTAAAEGCMAAINANHYLAALKG